MSKSLKIYAVKCIDTKSGKGFKQHKWKSAEGWSSTCWRCGASYS